MKNHPDHVKNSQIPPATSGLAWDEIRYVYDPLGRRLAKTVTENGAFKRATRFIYDGWNVVEERTERQGAPGISKFLFWGEDLSGSMQGAGGVGGLLTQMEKTDTTNWSASYYHYDGNGNVATVSGPFRAILAKFTYDGFGRTVTQTGAKSGIDITAIPYRFSTKPMELELATANTTLVPPPVSSGLYYYGYRFYSPNLGRWINRDPIREKGGRSIYGFILNNAINNVDLLGEVIMWSKIDLADANIHYRSGKGEAVQIAFSIVDTSEVKVADDFKDVEEWLENQTNWLGGCKAATKHFSDARYGFTTSGSGDAEYVLGDISLKYEGDVSIDCKCKFEITGILKSYDDTYDFNMDISRPWRSIKTIIGGGLAGAGTAYSIEIRGSKLVSESGTQGIW